MEVPEGMANLAFITDLTERKRAEAKQRESEERFRRLFEASPVAIEVSVRGVTQYANPAFLRAFGYERVEQVIGHSVLDHVAPSAREMIADRVVRRERGEPVPDAYETVGLRQDGGEFPFHIRMARLQTADGVAHLGFITDLTEQKRAEAGLKASEARFRSLFELSPLAIELSVDGVTLYANPA
jgi:PAS domain S-box-containing protein